MGQIIIDNGNVIVGCTDPLANNYNPLATEPCMGCCTYGTPPVIGCTDPLANNYNPLATEPCLGCCTYGGIVVETGGGLGTGTVSTGPGSLGGEIIVVPGGGLGTGTVGTGPNGGLGTGTVGTGSGGIGTGPSETNCPGPFSITIDGQVLGVNSAACCNGTVIGGGLPPEGYEYYWDGRNCYYREKIVCPTDFTCLNCNNLNWWNNTYITHHNNQSLQVSNPVLWNKIVDLVVNSGQTFYVQTSTGNLIDSNCCSQAGGTMVDGLCSCTKPPAETFTFKCISNITEFLALLGGPNGQAFFNANFGNIGYSLNLTNQQITFILTNLSLINDTIENAQATLILSNQLNISGGFYIKISDINGYPYTLNKGECDANNGYWDGSICKCKPPVKDCKIDITMVEVVSVKDFFNNVIQIVTLKDNTTSDTAQPVSISEQCCNKLINDYNLPWVYQGSYCYATPKDDCLPVIFNLNQNQMTVPPCENDLELSMWVYFGKPSNACQPIPDKPTDNVIIDGAFCDVVLSPNIGMVTTPLTGFTVGVGTVDTGTSFGTPNGSTVIVDGLGTGTVDTGGLVPTGLSFGRTSTAGNSIAGVDPNNGNIVVTPVVVSAATICCYNNLNPILARITTTNPLLNSSLIHIKQYNSVVDYFDTWVELKAKLPMSGLTLNFGLNLEIYQGLNCCCDYDIFVDDIKVSCSTEEPILVVNNIQCPGFELNRVIDNKKSWVYNPGTPEVGTSDYDVIEREDGSYGLLNGEGIINRTFAPSLDAEIPWRYTDYFEQSSVYERHSNLVLNSKELFLTFNMCSDCSITGSTLGCIDGYTLSGGTNVCYNLSGTTSAITVINTTYLPLLDLENYKKTFQSFWLQFMEQFVPATTIWVAGEKWCNRPEDVCSVIDPCDYDFELVDSDVIVQSIPPSFFPTNPTSVAGGSISTVPTNVTSKVSMGTPSGSIPDTSKPILDGPVILIPFEDYGLVTTTTLLPTTDALNVDFQAYQDKFTDTITITEIIAAP